VRVRSERDYRFAADAEAVWAAMNAVDRFPAWWPWLTAFDGVRLAEGERWRCRLRAPLPYSIDFTVVFTAVVPGQRVEARIDGDVRGAAQLTLWPGRGSCAVRLASQLEPVAAMPRTIGALVPVLARSGHRQVLDRGAAAFGHHLR